VRVGRMLQGGVRRTGLVAEGEEEGVEVSLMMRPRRGLTESGRAGGAARPRCSEPVSSVLALMGSKETQQWPVGSDLARVFPEGPERSIANLDESGRCNCFRWASRGPVLRAEPAEVSASCGRRTVDHFWNVPRQFSPVSLEFASGYGCL